jgi:hypothetical protein
MQMKRDMPDYGQARLQQTPLLDGAGGVKTEPYAPDVARLKDLAEKTNGYSAEIGDGDNGTGTRVG